jgi:hypothetical protein
MSRQEGRKTVKAGRKEGGMARKEGSHGIQRRGKWKEGRRADEGK